MAFDDLSELTLILPWGAIAVARLWRQRRENMHPTARANASQADSVRSGRLVPREIRRTASSRDASPPRLGSDRPARALHANAARMGMPSRARGFGGEKSVENSYPKDLRKLHTGQQRDILRASFHARHVALPYPQNVSRLRLGSGRPACAPRANAARIRLLAADRRPHSLSALPIPTP